jgi:general secretion pathway protein K
VLIVSFLASQLILQVRTELKIAANEQTREVSRFLSEAGINLALFRLSRDFPPESADDEEEKFRHGHLYEDQLPTGLVRYLVVSESGKINLHNAPRPLLTLFLQHHGLGPEEIEIVIDSLFDWQDSDDLRRLHGAEAEYYLGLEEPYLPRNGPIQDPAEFFLVRGAGMLKGRFPPEDIFTSHNPGNRINFNSLTPAMLDFLMGGDSLRKEAYQEARRLFATLDEELALEIMGEERFEELRDYLLYERPRRNPHYTIEASGLAGDFGEEQEQGREGSGYKIKARVRIIGSVIHYLSWVEDQV